MMRLQFLAGLCLATAGCGGGGGTSGGGTVVVPPITSTPTPTPSSSPPPPIDFTRDFAFTSELGYAVRVFTHRDGVESTPINQVKDGGISAGPPVALTFNAGNGSLMLAYGTETLAFSGAERVADQRYSGSDGRYLAFYPVASSFKYVVSAYAKAAAVPYILDGKSGMRATHYVGIFGYGSTVTSRMEGALNVYPGQPILNSAPAKTQLRAGDLRLWVNSGQNYHFGSLSLSKVENGAEVNAGSLTLRGTLNEATNVFSGTISDPVSGYNGTFRGALFGPNREEVGILFSFSRPLDGGAIYAGEMLAKREYAPN